MGEEFELILSDFSSELDALAEMAAVPGRAGPVPQTPRARIAAGNGATLLMAATFEEFVRQQVRAAFREKVKRAKSISDFPSKIASTVWRRSLESLAKMSFADIESDGRRVGATLEQTQMFCLRKIFTADVAESLSHNESNMRPGQLGALFNQIGITSIISKAAKYEPVVEFLGVGSPDKATGAIETRMEQFFRRRNDIAHAISQSTSSGPAELAQDIEFFRFLGEALTAALVREFTDQPLEAVPA